VALGDARIALEERAVEKARLAEETKKITEEAEARRARLAAEKARLTEEATREPRLLLSHLDGSLIVVNGAFAGPLFRRFVEQGGLAEAFRDLGVDPTRLLDDDPEARRDLVSRVAGSSFVTRLVSSSVFAQVTQEFNTVPRSAGERGLLSGLSDPTGVFHMTPSRASGLGIAIDRVCDATDGADFRTRNAAYFTGPRGTGKSTALLQLSMAASVLAMLKGRQLHAIIVRHPPGLTPSATARSAQLPSQRPPPDAFLDPRSPVAQLLFDPWSLVWRGLQVLGRLPRVDESPEALLEFARSPWSYWPPTRARVDWLRSLQADKAGILMCMDEVQDYHWMPEMVDGFRRFVMDIVDTRGVHLLLTGSSSYTSPLIRVSQADTSLLESSAFKDVAPYLRSLNDSKVVRSGSLGLLHDEECLPLLRGARTQVSGEVVRFMDSLSGAEADRRSVSEFFSELNFILGGLHRTLLSGNWLRFVGVEDGKPKIMDSIGLMGISQLGANAAMAPEGFRTVLDGAALFLIAHQASSSNASSSAIHPSGLRFPPHRRLMLDQVFKAAEAEARKQGLDEVAAEMKAARLDQVDIAKKAVWKNAVLGAEELGLISTTNDGNAILTFEQKRWAVEAVTSWISRHDGLTPLETAALLDPSSGLHVVSFERLVTAELLAAGLHKLSEASMRQHASLATAAAQDVAKVLEGVPSVPSLLDHRQSSSSVEAERMPVLQLWGGANAKTRKVVEGLDGGKVKVGTIYKEMNDWGTADTCTVLLSADKSVVYIVRTQCKGSISEAAFPLRSAWPEAIDMRDAVVAPTETVVRNGESKSPVWLTGAGSGRSPLAELLAHVDDDHAASAKDVVLVNLFMTVGSFQKSTEAEFNRTTDLEVVEGGIEVKGSRKRLQVVTMLADQETTRGLWSKTLVQTAELIGIQRYSEKNR
jgi:hypothetical protein